MRKFIILTTGRTGSTYLRLLLNNHPEVRCHCEVFNRGYGALDGFYKYSNKSYAIKFQRKLCGDHSISFRKNFVTDKLFANFLNELYEDATASGPWTSKSNWHDFHSKDMSCKVVGFKLIYEQFLYYQKHILPWIKNDNVSIIHLIRENILEIFLSFQRAINSGTYHIEDKNEKLHNKIYIKPEKAIKFIEDTIKERKKMLSLFNSNPIFGISYEDIFSTDGNDKIKDLFNFLNVSTNQFPTPPSLKKLGTKNLADEVSNYNEIVEKLSNTPYFKLLSA